MTNFRPLRKRSKNMLRLQNVQKKDRDLLWNINQKYLYEMTNFYDDPMDAIGNYHYGYFDEYFSDPMRVAYFIFNDDLLVGFAMICPYSNIDQNPDYTMAEFTIFPAYRRKHFAIDAVEMILDKHSGKWEIKYNEKNSGAKKLWNTVAAPYEPEVHHLNDNETVLSFMTAEKIADKCADYSIKKVTIDDYDAIYELWSSTEQSRRALNPVDDSREGIARYLKRNPDTCFAAVKDGKIIGVILTGHDGRRAIVHHLCVHPDCRRMGIAGHLVSQAEEALQKEGIQKVFGLVFKDNESANAFWEQQGSSLRTNLNYRNKSLNDQIPAGE